MIKSHKAECMPRLLPPEMFLPWFESVPATEAHIADDYMGEHWLASFAVLALDDED